MTWFLLVFFLTHSFWKWALFTVPLPSPFYSELIRFFSVSRPVYLMTRPRCLMLIDPLWEKQETLYTKSFKSSQIKTELIYISGEIWNCSLLSWGPFTSCRKVNLGHSPIPCMHWRRKWQPTPVFLPGESQGRRGLVGCRLWGRTESDTTEAT